MPDWLNNIGKRQAQANNKIVEPIKFVQEEQKDKKIKPFYTLENHPNDKYRFAILSSTENGKYIRGGMLFFEFNGIEIYTELNNAIFVDLIHKTCFIKDYHKVKEEITPVDAEQRQYIILMSSEDENGDQIYTWEAMTGRTTMYEYIVDNIDELGIDPEKSFILVETVPYKDALTVTEFVKYLKNAEYVPDDGFDIDEYII